MSNIELHFTNRSYNQTALALLQQNTPLTSAQLKSAVSKGALWLEKGKSVQRLRRVKKEINVGETLHFYYNPEVLAQQPLPATLIDDQKDYSIWYKPSGMFTQGSKWSDHCTITRFSQTHLSGERQSFLVHRLDRATSGLIVIAHNKKTARLLSQMFEHRRISKQYQAVVWLDSVNAIEHITVKTPIDHKTATSHFTLIDSTPIQNLALYDIDIDTGRKHQIRQHAKSLYLPIVGDRLYGVTKDGTNEKVDLQLCATQLSFTCPITGEQKNYHLPPSLRLSLATVVERLVG